MTYGPGSDFVSGWDPTSGGRIGFRVGLGPASGGRIGFRVGLNPMQTVPLYLTPRVTIMPGQDKQQEKLNMTDESKTPKELGDANQYYIAESNEIQFVTWFIVQS